MSIVGKKKVVRKELQSTAKAKPALKVKNIGLDEKIAEANRLFRLLKNPEILFKK